MKETTSQRIKEIMVRDGLRQVDILEKCKPYCEKYGIQIRRGDLSQYVSGKVRPNQYRTTILALALGVSEPWLMGYDDEDDVADELITKFNQLSNDDKKEILAMIDYKLARNKK